MTLSVITFLQTLATFGLVLWRPEAASTLFSKFVMFCASGFFAVIFLLAGLSTLWWPPSMHWVIVWSAVTLALLAWVVIQQD